MTTVSGLLPPSRACQQAPAKTCHRRLLHKPGILYNQPINRLMLLKATIPIWGR